MKFYAPFCLPFLVGALVMAAVIVWKYVVWFAELPRADKKRVLFGIPTPRTLGAVGEVIGECLLHRRIFRVNPLLGYMHMSLAFGWFLLIVVGWIETVAYLGLRWVPLQGHVFFKYFAPTLMLREKPFFDFVMDLLLLFVLSGVALAWAKRFCSRAMGMRRTTRHVPGDRIALTALWFVFPARLAAESITCGIYGMGGFLTGGGVHGRASRPVDARRARTGGVVVLFDRARRLLRRAAVFALHAYLHRDPAHLPASLRCAPAREGVVGRPLPDRSLLAVRHLHRPLPVAERAGHRRRAVGLLSARSPLRDADARSGTCPVGIDLNTLRLNSRDTMRNTPDERRYDYFKGLDRSEGEGKVGYFAGCMTLLTPRTMTAMERIFTAAGEEVWWADRNGGVCCGRPLKLSGETDSARRMMEYNTQLFRRHGIRTLVTSCPICLKVFREEYRLDGIRVIHHSQYILELLSAGRLRLERGAASYAYHDPCELGRGSGIYDEPRRVIEAVGRLLEPAHTREDALCCGSSVANTVISDGDQVRIATSVAGELTATGADAIVTACPLCKKALVRGTTTEVCDLAEIVAKRIH